MRKEIWPMDISTKNIIKNVRSALKLLAMKLSIANVKYISNVMWYIMLYMLEKMRKEKHKIGTLRIRGLRGSALLAYIHEGIS